MGFCIYQGGISIAFFAYLMKMRCSTNPSTEGVFKCRRDEKPGFGSVYVESFEDRRKVVVNVAMLSSLNSLHTFVLNLIEHPT